MARPDYRIRARCSRSLQIPTGFGVRIQHPPRRLAGALVLDAHEAIVQRQIVPDRVLYVQIREQLNGLV